MQNIMFVAPEKPIALRKDKNLILLINVIPFKSFVMRVKKNLLNVGCNFVSLFVWMLSVESVKSMGAR